MTAYLELLMVAPALVFVAWALVQNRRRGGRS